MTFWDLFTGRQLGGDCSSLTLPSGADKKVKVPMSGIVGFQGQLVLQQPIVCGHSMCWRLCQMTLKSPDPLLDTN